MEYYLEVFMLLSFYASVRCARKRNYAAKMAVFVVVVSLLSAVFGISIIAVLYGPVAVLSFPFYAFWEEKRFPLSAPYEVSQRIVVYDIYLGGVPVSSLVPQGRVVSDVGGGVGYVDVASYEVTFLGVEVGSVPESSIGPIVFLSLYPLLLPLWFFMLVNAVGALLGFLASRMAGGMPVFQRGELKLMSSLASVILGFVFLGVGILLSDWIVALYGVVWFGVFIVESALRRARNTRLSPLLF